VPPSCIAQPLNPISVTNARNGQPTNPHTLDCRYAKYPLALPLAAAGVTFPMYRNVRALFITDMPLGESPAALVDHDLHDRNFHLVVVDALEFGMVRHVTRTYHRRHRL
jgi:hypothetical protein